MATNHDFDKKVRKTWNISPIEKVKKSKKKYNRKKKKLETEEIIKEIDEKN